VGARLRVRNGPGWVWPVREVQASAGGVRGAGRGELPVLGRAAAGGGAGRVVPGVGVLVVGEERVCRGSGAGGEGVLGVGMGGGGLGRAQGGREERGGRGGRGERVRGRARA
jgi:hypothetical protein